MKFKVKTPNLTAKANIFSMVLALSIISLLIYFTGCSTKNKFQVSDLVNFYVVSKNGVIGYQVNETNPSKITQTRTEIYRSNVNATVMRAELDKRHLVFTEDGWPLGLNEGIVSLDFDSGKINRLTTNQIAYTAAGSTDKYYFAAISSKPTDIWLYNAELKRISALQLDPPMILTNFKSNNLHIYTVGVEIDESIDEYNNPYFKTNLIEFDVYNDQLAIKSITELKPLPTKQVFLQDVTLINNHLYMISSGGRDSDSQERYYEGNLYKYNLKNNSGNLISLEEFGPSTSFTLSEDTIAIVHNPSLGAKRRGFSIYDVSTDRNEFIDFDMLGIQFEGDNITDIKKYKDNSILILIDDRIYCIDLNTKRVIFEITNDLNLNESFHIWVVQ